MQRQPKTRPKQSFKDSSGLTEKHHGETVKIQNILKQYQNTGFVSHTAKTQPIYGDMASAPDFYQAQCILAETSSMFEEVPATIRKQFENDPGKYLEFIQNPENKEAMTEMGIDSSHIPENYEKPLSKDETDQLHLEDLIDRKIQQEASPSLSDANEQQLKAALAKIQGASMIPKDKQF